MQSLATRLWKLEGTVGRTEYAVAGVVGFLLKYAVDWSIAQLFAKRWTPLSYWSLLHATEGADRVTTQLFFSLFAVSVPFLWFGMAMTLLRLRSAGRSAGWAAFFFVPVLNVLLFVALVILPPSDQHRRRDLSGTLESALFAVLLTVGVATLAILLATHVVKTYGFGLFIAVPFCVGYLAAFLQRRRHPESAVRPYVSALLSLALLGGLLLAMAWEGLVCLAMAAPLAITVAIIGAYLGAHTSAAGGPQGSAGARALACVAFLPLCILSEAALRLPAPSYRVDTSVIINAPQATVWRNVVSFPPITTQPEWYFRAGISYPLRARINGNGVGAVRYCEFTTGAFVEPVTVWKEPRVLSFDVIANPPPMRELSPIGDIDAPHLHGFLVSHAGQFELRPLSKGRTLLVGTTWYQHHLWPAAYWRLWSDAIIHRIHLRVLGHIKSLAERANQGTG
jgi:hypothetical protein